MKQANIRHQFVEYIPERLEEGLLYISQKYGTATHKCCCGCGEEVVTPLNPTDWSLRIDGDLATLDPSIGNWSYACRSHYWIRRSQVIWAAPMAQWQIDRIRAFDRSNKEAYFRVKNQEKERPTQAPQPPPTSRIQAEQPGLFTRFLRALSDWWNRL